MVSVRKEILQQIERIVKLDFTPTENSNVGINSSLVNQILELIKNNQGINVKGIAKLIPNVVERTIERQIKELRNKGIVEFRGAPKSGGYYVNNL